jgi:uncharacterized protein YdhG (YjbR/CyaY superfamily)
MSVINEYLKNVPEPQKSELERIRKIIVSAVPDATEAISYGIPGYKYNGKYLITFAVFKDHLSLFPGAHAIEKLQKELSEFKLSKGTVQFTLEKPLPESLITQLIEIRKADIDG